MGHSSKGGYDRPIARYDDALKVNPQPKRFPMPSAAHLSEGDVVLAHDAPNEN
jgi:hypothetical protein